MEYQRAQALADGFGKRQIENDFSKGNVKSLPQRSGKEKYPKEIGIQGEGG